MGSDVEAKGVSGLATGLAILGLILGILALLSAFVPLLGALAFFLGVPAAAISLLALVIAIARKAPTGLCIGALLVCVAANAISWWQYSTIVRIGEKSRQFLAERNPTAQSDSRFTATQAVRGISDSTGILVQGRVVFGKDAIPLPGATVKGTGDTIATTDLAGRFAFTIAPGTSALTITAPRFPSKLHLVSDGENLTELQIALPYPDNLSGPTWKKFASLGFPITNPFSMLIHNDTIYLFYSKGYIYSPFVTAGNENSWKFIDYPRVSNRSFELGSRASNCAAIVGDRVFMYTFGDYYPLYSATIGDDGGLHTWQMEFYAPQIKRGSLMFSHQERLYVGFPTGYYQTGMGRATYGIADINTNGTVAMWQSLWCQPMDSVGAIDADAAVAFNGHLHVIAGQEVSYFPIMEDGALNQISHNARLPKEHLLLRTVVIGGRLHVLSNSGEMYVADISKAPDIYSWETIRESLPTVNFDMAGRPIGGFDVAQTRFGAVLIYNYLRNESHGGSARNRSHVDIFFAVDYSLADPEDIKGTPPVSRRPDELTIKPESEIRLLRYDADGSKLVGWDEIQKRWIVSEDNGESWKFWGYTAAPGSYGKTDGTIWLALEQFPNNGDWLALHQTGLYRVSADFSTWRKVEGGLPSFELETVNVNEWPSQSGRIAIDLANPERVLVALGGSVYKSVDSGHNWLRRDNGLRNDGNTLQWVKGIEDHVLCLTIWGLYVSTDAGGTWAEFFEWAKSNAWAIKLDMDDEYLRLHGGLHSYIGRDHLSYMLPQVVDGIVYLVGQTHETRRVLTVNFWEKSCASDSVRVTEGCGGSHAVSAGEDGKHLLIGGESGMCCLEVREGSLVVFDSKDISKVPFYSFTVNPVNSSEVVAGSLGAVRYSRDGGRTWK